MCVIPPLDRIVVCNSLSVVIKFTFLPHCLSNFIFVYNLISAFFQQQKSQCNIYSVLLPPSSLSPCLVCR